MDVTRSPAEYDEVLVMERGPSFPNVPYDVQLKILMYLDARVQMRVQCVCLAWKDILSSSAVASQVILDLSLADGLAAGCHDAFGFDKVITSRTRTVIIYAALNTLLEDADGLVTTETPPPPEYTKFPIWEWFKLQQAGVNLQTLVLEMLEIEMACLLENLPATVSRLVLRTCRITYASSVLVDMGDDCCFDVDVPNFEIEIPIHQERPVMTNSKLQEMINVFARPLSHQERMELEEAKTVQQNDFLAAGLNNIIKIWELEIPVVDFDNGVPPLDQLKPGTLRHLLEKSRQYRRWISEDDPENDWEQDYMDSDDSAGYVGWSYSGSDSDW